MSENYEEINFFCILTEFYKPLFESLFLKSFKNCKSKCIAIENKQLHGDYFKSQFKKIIHFKIENIIKSLKENKIAIWTDIDIVFPMGTDIIIDDLKNRINDFDLLISRENRKNHDINSGFFICKSNEKTIDFFECLLKETKKKKTTEQQIMQKLLYQSELKWGILPKTYWNSTVGFPLPAKPFMIHANHLPSLLQKIKFKGENAAFKKCEALKFLLLKTKFKNLI